MKSASGLGQRSGASQWLQSEFACPLMIRCHSPATRLSAENIVPQVAISTIRALANAQIVQILDNNGDLPITQRRYKQEVASCTECMRLLRVLKEEVTM